MGLSYNNIIKLNGHIKCQSCDNIFPKEFADKCLGWVGTSEEYEEYEMPQYFGTYWKSYDKRGQWYWWNRNFICPECAQKLIDNGKAKIAEAYHEYYTTQEYDKLPESEKQYAKPHKWNIETDIPPGSDVRVPYNILRQIRKKK